MKYNERILFTKEEWRNSPLSVARYYGGIRINGQEYVIVNKEGKDLHECSIDAEKAGRKMAIEAGEPADLINAKYLKEYRELGREKFLEKYNLL